jgi:hypothetical protein
MMNGVNQIKANNHIDVVHNQIKRLLQINILIVMSGMLIWRFLLHEHSVIIVIISFLLPSITYFGIMDIFESLGIGLGVNKGTIRTAMVSAVLVLFFFVYPVSLFVDFGRADPATDFARQMTQSFTNMLTIMIPFYFAASVYVQTHESSKSNGDESSKINGDDKKEC